MRRLLLLPPVLLLAACEQVALVDPADDFLERSEAYNDMAGRVLDMDVATAAEVPASGGAVYAGYAALGAGGEDGAVLVGDSRIAVDFADAEVSGTLDDFVGVVGDGAARSYEGELSITGGRLGGLTASGWDAAVQGELSSGRNDLAVDGSLVGVLLSEDGRDVAGLRGVAGAGTGFELDGRAVGGTLDVVGERGALRD